MNIEQYRALKAQQEQQQAQQIEQPVVEPKQVEEPKPTEKPVAEEPKSTDTKEDVKLPEKIEIPSIGEVTIDELKNGYLRQSDYTRKTQELSRKSKEVEQAVQLYEQLRQNPQIAQQMFNPQNLPPSLDPTQAKIMELENKLYDMMLEREIEVLQNKYPDFEVREVLETAHTKKMTDLEDVYLLLKAQKTTENSPLDVNKLKEDIRRELLKELEAEKDSVQSIISSNDAGQIVQDNTPKLSEAEKRVARMMKLSESDYIKWRDAGRK